MKLAFALFLAAAVAVSAVPSPDTKAELPKLEWWENGLFYQIYPRSFKDSTGNGIGDLKGVIEKLPYLKELGIDGAWLSPIFKSPMADHGYDIEDFYTVDPIFGTNADAEELFKKAKELGIKIVLDFVPNHSSNQSEWFLKSIDKHPDYKDYYVWANAKMVNGKRTPPNNWVRYSRETLIFKNAFTLFFCLFR